MIAVDVEIEDGNAASWCKQLDGRDVVSAIDGYLGPFVDV